MKKKCFFLNRSDENQNKTFFFIFPALLCGSKVLLLVFANIELSLNFSSSSFVIRVNLFYS